ncbi:unnamed protein product [Linum trigynum]|uniref:Uncharacterized protein n=1 Tax=Linum trigynum TaxID=586398 RepID=A0AAV2G804_9ROSI
MSPTFSARLTDDGVFLVCFPAQLFLLAQSKSTPWTLSTQVEVRQPSCLWAISDMRPITSSRLRVTEERKPPSSTFSSLSGSFFSSSATIEEAANRTTDAFVVSTFSSVSFSGGGFFSKVASSTTNVAKKASIKHASTSVFFLDGRQIGD